MELIKKHLFIIVIFIVTLSVLVVQLYSPKQSSLSSSSVRPYINSSKQNVSDQLTAESFKKRIVKQKEVVKAHKNQDVKSQSYQEKKTSKSSDGYLKPVPGIPSLVLGSSKTDDIIPVMSKLTVRLLEPLSSLNYSQPVHAVILDDLVLDNGKKISLKNTHLVGDFLVFKNDERIFISFTKLIVGDQTFSINAQAVDFDGKRGLIPDFIDEKHAQKFLKNILDSATVLLNSISDNPISQSAFDSVGDVVLNNIEVTKLIRLNPKNIIVVMDDIVKI